MNRVHQMGVGKGSGVSAGTAAVAGACLIWAFNFIPTKIAVREIDPLALLLVRTVLSAPIFIIVLRAGGERLRGLLPHWRRGLILAILALTGDQLLFLFGLKYTTAAHGALMYSLIPIFVAILAFPLIGERIGLSRIAGIAIAFVGAVILISEGGLTFDSRYLAGDLMMLSAALCWSLYIVLSKPLVERIGAVRTITLVFVIGLPLVLPFTIFPALAQPWHRVTPVGYASVAYIVLGASVVAYLFYQFALKKLPASAVAPAAYATPVLVAIFSVLLLGETLSPAFFVAAALVLTGLIIARKRR